jgi:L,D-transpeptidase catalytic domain
MSEYEDSRPATRHSKVSPMIAICPPKRRLAGFVATGLAALLAAAMADPAAARSNRDREIKQDETALSRAAGTPLLAIVSLSDQRVTIYDAQGRILRAPVSSGQTGYETPAGIYSVIQKEAEHYSNLYDDASMPFMQRITWSGIALHAGALPGHPASHGCIRMPHGFAERLFDLTKMGMRVIVMPSDAAPIDIVHPALFKPRPIGGEIAVATPPASNDTQQKMRLGGVTPDANVPPPTVSPKQLETLKSIAATKQAEAEVAARKADEARLASTRSTGEAARAAKAVRLAENAKSRADAQLKSAEQALEAATGSPAKERAEEAKSKAEAKVAEANAQLETAKADAAAKADAVAGMREAAKTAEATRVAAANAAKEATARMSPVSVFISRQTQKLYVRQAFQPLFDTPVTIRDADQPIGTHIYTALDYTNDGADVRWSVVSMTRSQGQEGRESDSYGNRRSRYASRSAEPAMTDVAGAKSALDRVTIPKEAMDRIAEVVSPGSSVIISDEPISKETGKGTDFIVLMSGEPQGGIKIRRRPQPWGGDDEYGYRRSPYGRSPYWGGSPFRW